ncbi:C-type lectin c [Plakobranchus ocellatus]|uniref:C-type lectin c n=1 Tax=Plakobranchus ocellatus TaxID=259542 RepID=A0AAV4DWS6_9GAST|nr:C-type lectin c [Plakobranchus ocellatus]
MERLSKFLFVLSVTLPVVLSQASNPAQDLTACDEGWAYFNSFCYYFSETDEARPFEDAISECLAQDAELARPESGKELKFLQTQAKTRQVYGWILNWKQRRDYGVSGAPTIYQQYNVRKSRYEPFTPVNEMIPKLEPSFDGTSKCIALHAQRSILSHRFYQSKSQISTEPCDLLLWVVCQGKKSDFSSQMVDYINWFSTDSLVVWITNKLANQPKAKEICQSEGMQLVTSVNEVMKAINRTFDYTPWWTGLDLNQNGAQLEDGSAVNFNDLSWYSGDEDSGSLMLLHSGNGRLETLWDQSTAGLPYICKKIALENNQFGCPNFWLRGGRSCFLFNNHSPLEWTKAKEYCERRKAHLLSIDSFDKRWWAETVIKSITLRNYIFTWTSGNDLSKEGNFTWHDGSPISNKFFPWFQSPFEARFRSNIYSVQCATYEPTGNFLNPTECNSRSNPSCQYSLQKSETSCASNWEKIDGTCYFLEKESKAISYNAIQAYCGSIVQGIAAYRISPIVVKTEKVIEFFSAFLKQHRLGYRSWWIGMRLSSKTFGQWEWVDRSKVDFSLFGLKEEPNNGNGKEPENCVAIGTLGMAFDETCDSKIHFICEKELPPISFEGNGVDQGNGVMNIHKMLFTPAMHVFLSIVTLHLLSKRI